MRAGAIHAALRALPVAPLAAIAPETVLVLAPHPDDESLGCGGLIAEACAENRPPLVVVATDGTGSHPNSATHPPARLRELRESEAMEAVSHLGLPADRLRFLRLPDTAAPHDGPALDEAVERLSTLAQHFHCAAILAPWRHDPHGDHLACWRMAEQLARKNRLHLLAYPVWGWLIAPDTELDGAVPRGHRLDIARHLPAKARAIAAHRSQYGALITDSPGAFKLPDALLEVFRQPFECVLLP